MWTTWMCLPVAVPAHPRILAGRRFLRISPDISGDISGDRGVAGFPGDPILSTQRFLRGRDRDFIYTKNSGGRPCRKWLFYWGKIGQRLRIFGFWSGDDARENGDFQRKKQRLQGTKNFMKIIFLNIVNVDDIESLWHFAKEAGALYGKWNMYWIY